MNVERDIAGFALPFAAGVLITAYAESLFCRDFSSVSFIASIVIFVAVFLLLNRREYGLGAYVSWVVAGTAAFGCGMLAAATAASLFKTPEPGFLVACRRIGTSLQTMIDSIPFSSEGTSALIKALLTGERSGLSSEIKSAFRDSGASHILALSGLHLGIIYGILSKLLSILGNSPVMRILRSILIILICGIYTLATGAGDSLVRALIFISLREIAKAVSRYHGLGQILLASLIIQLVIDPLAVRSVGFQLSYAAMAGIAFIYPWLQGFWDRAAEFLNQTTSHLRTSPEVPEEEVSPEVPDKETSPEVPEEETSPGVPEESHGKTGLKCAGLLISWPARWIWNTVSLAIACQITTAPLAYMYFGTFPVHFMLTNLLTLPLTGLLIPSALLTLCLTAIGCCPSILVHATEWLTCTLVWLLEVISAM